MVLVVVVLAVWMVKGFSRKDESEFSAVYLTSGDIYFGKLSWFPRPTLTNVWYLQRGVSENNQPQLGVLPLKSVFWGPVDEITLNPKNILFWTNIRPDSEMAKALANPNSVPPVQQEAPTGQ